MSWKDLIQHETERLTLPWLGGRALMARDRSFRVAGPLPREMGWYAFEATSARSVRLQASASPDTSVLSWISLGYLVGDRFLRDDVRVDTDPVALLTRSSRVHLIE